MIESEESNPLLKFNPHRHLKHSERFYFCALTRRGICIIGFRIVILPDILIPLCAKVDPGVYKECFPDERVKKGYRSILTAEEKEH